MKIPFLKEDLIRSGGLIFLSILSASVIAFFANLIISNILGPEQFGVFKTVIYFFAFLPALIDFGINSSLTKYVSELKDKNKAKYLIIWFLKIKFLTYIFLIIVIFLFKDYIALYFLKDTSLNYLVLGGLLFTTSSFFSSFSSIVLGLQNFKIFSLSQFLNSSSSAILAVLLSPFGIFYMILGWGIGPILGNIPTILYLSKKKIKTEKKFDIKKIFFKFSLPIYPIEVLAAVSNSIVPLLSLFFSQKLIGYYSFAFMFYYAALLIPNSLSLVLFPKVSELNGLGKHHDAKNILRKSFLYYSLIAIPGLIFASFFSEWFINIAAQSYLPSLIIFKIIVSLSFIFGYNVIYINYLKGLGKIRKFALFTLIQNIVLIAISLFLLNYISL